MIYHLNLAAELPVCDLKPFPLENLKGGLTILGQEDSPWDNFFPRWALPNFSPGWAKGK